jgi:NADPH-dependent ferric siderophore reductase
VTEHDGSIRVAGMVARWPDMPAVSGAWAISASKGDRIAIFAVRKRNVPQQCCCK